ncbi:MAG: hypothetical protein OXM61_10695 [Candidatus Poribacteria bacterium]|nr:hypothetical protein [Candidatus Poribacteria bacterium]
MPNDFIYKFSTTTYVSLEGKHTLVLISYKQAPIDPCQQQLALEAALFCERLFRGTLPFIGYINESENNELIYRQCAQIHKNVYLLPINHTPTSLELTEPNVLVCNAPMWELLKNEDIDFDAQECHKKYNVYQVWIG